jgi:hypothetical protein
LVVDIQSVEGSVVAVAGEICLSIHTRLGSSRKKQAIIMLCADLTLIFKGPLNGPNFVFMEKFVNNNDVICLFT